MRVDQAVLNNTIEGCPCCDRIWMSLNTWAGTPSLSYDGFNAEVENTHVWQKLSVYPNTWVDLQTGGIEPEIPPGDDGDLVRVKYTDSKGCIHYSNVSNIYFP